MILTLSHFKSSLQSASSIDTSLSPSESNKGFTKKRLFSERTPPTEEKNPNKQVKMDQEQLETTLTKFFTAKTEKKR